jgi:hypothetical protein
VAFDLDSRIPCIDDACTGVLDANGRCGTCGRQATPEERAATGAAASASAGSGADLDAADDADDGGERAASSGYTGGDGEDDDDSPGDADGAGDAAAAGSDFDPDRRLCPDGACIGVIGPDNRCKVCGLAADAQVGAD